MKDAEEEAEGKILGEEDKEEGGGVSDDEGGMLIG
jgi:hypothetical protein